MNEKEKFPLVSIISVNYNQVDVTCDLLSSLRKISYPNIEIIIVDNASPSEDPAPLKERYPEITLIQSNKNLGFAGGNNLGIRAAKGDYLLFINNDTEVESDFLEPMIELFESDPKIGMISPKIRFHHTPDTIQYAGYTPMNPYTFRQNLIGYRKKDVGQFEDIRETYSIHGAAMMVPAKVVKEVGLMAEQYFLYYEEHDWATRIKKAGYKIFYQPRSLVYHKESISTGKESPLKIYYIARNRIVYARRNSSASVLWLNVLYFYTVALVKNSFDYIFRGDFKLLSAYWRGLFWNVVHFKGIKTNPILS